MLDKVYGGSSYEVPIAFAKFELLITLAFNYRFVYMDGLF